MNEPQLPSTIASELALQKQRLETCRAYLQIAVCEAKIQQLDTKTLIKESNQANTDLKTGVTELKECIDIEIDSQKRLEAEMIEKKAILDSLQDQLRAETESLELCAIENQLILRTLQIDITPASISVPIRDLNRST